MAVTKKDETKVASRVFAWVSLVVAVVVVVASIVSWQAGKSIVSTVNKSLKEQKIYFPPAGHPTFSVQAYPAAQKYAGKQVDDGKKAKAYAEDYLGVQIKLLGSGKTLAEVSTALAASPLDPQLQQLQGTMFQLETNKTTLIADSYGIWSQGMAMQSAGMIGLVASAGLLLISGFNFMRYKKP
jgi:hypothetical protein